MGGGATSIATGAGGGGGGGGAKKPTTSQAQPTPTTPTLRVTIDHRPPPPARTLRSIHGNFWGNGGGNGGSRARVDGVENDGVGDTTGNNRMGNADLKRNQQFQQQQREQQKLFHYHNTEFDLRLKNITAKTTAPSHSRAKSSPASNGRAAKICPCSMGHRRGRLLPMSLPMSNSR
mmetsp:Transcript_22003/g.46303  ORF Transcript_22003/g.46303 Transcript_22003/m.46303 type:complete len:176 (-) Transcript_22003:468-995(-)